MSNFRIGDVISDCNPTWERFRETGTVVSVRKDKVTWRSHKDNELVVDHMGDMVRIKSTNNNLNRRSKMRSPNGSNRPKKPGSHNKDAGVPNIVHTPFGTEVTSYGPRGVGHVKKQGSWKKTVNSVRRGFRGMAKKFGKYASTNPVRRRRRRRR